MLMAPRSWRSEAIQSLQSSQPLHSESRSQAPSVAANRVGERCSSAVGSRFTAKVRIQARRGTRTSLRTRRSSRIEASRESGGGRYLVARSSNPPPRVKPNPSIKRTPSGSLCLPTVAAHVKR